MHYKGYVHCRCFQEGKTRPAPFPKELKYNEQGFYFDREIGDKSIPLFKKQVQLEAWKKSACRHPNMEFAAAIVANEMGLENFSAFLYKNGGAQAYPKTLEVLPKIGQEPIPSNEAHELMEELNILKKRARLTSTAKQVLREAGSHQIIMIGDREDEIIFAALKNGHVFLLKEEHFLILKRSARENEPFTRLFQAHSFYTKTINSHQVEFFDGFEGNAAVTTTRGLGTPKAKGIKTHYVVSTEIVNNYNYWKTLIDGLESLLKASIETENAILWEVVNQK